jgi:hypothetical protein
MISHFGDARALAHESRNAESKWDAETSSRPNIYSQLLHRIENGLCQHFPTSQHSLRDHRPHRPEGIRSTGLRSQGEAFRYLFSQRRGGRISVVANIMLTMDLLATMRLPSEFVLGV